jgi:hypothetical protein
MSHHSHGLPEHSIAGLRGDQDVSGGVADSGQLDELMPGR